MKKSNVRIVLFVLLLLASLGSYIYLNTTAEVLFPVEEEEQKVSDEQEGEMALPDVQLLEIVIEGGKRFLPAS